MNKDVASWRTLRRLLLLGLAFYALAKASAPAADNLPPSNGQQAQEGLPHRAGASGGLSRRPEREPKGETSVLSKSTPQSIRAARS